MLIWETSGHTTLSGLFVKIWSTIFMRLRGASLARKLSRDTSFSCPLLFSFIFIFFFFFCNAFQQWSEIYLRLRSNLKLFTEHFNCLNQRRIISLQVSDDTHFSSREPQFRHLIYQYLLSSYYSTGTAALEIFSHRDSSGGFVSDVP